MKWKTNDMDFRIYSAELLFTYLNTLQKRKDRERWDRKKKSFTSLVRQDNETPCKAVLSGKGEKNWIIKQDACGSKKNLFACLFI